MKTLDQIKQALAEAENHRQELINELKELDSILKTNSGEAFGSTLPTVQPTPTKETRPENSAGLTDNQSSIIGFASRKGGPISAKEVEKELGVSYITANNGLKALVKSKHLAKAGKQGKTLLYSLPQ